MFRPMPADTGLGFVIVTHLARGQHSSLAEILRRHTILPVKDAEADEEIRANHIYFCPPDHILTVADGMIQLHERTSDLQRRPIDVCLTSAAQDHSENTVGILLSGGGTDGTLGMKAIKEAGGLTIAQGSDGTAPQHAGMPESAIGAGVVDLVIPVEAIGARLAQFARDSRGTQHRAVAERDGALHQEIYRILLSQVGHDFSGYKEKTFTRRVARRMQVIEVDTLADYVERLRTDADEVGLLFRDLLIGVTNFFRDADAFAALETMVIPELFAGQGRVRRGARLGPGLRHRRGGLLAGDPAARARRDAPIAAADPDLRHRHRRPCARGGARRPLSRRDAERHHARAPAAPLHRRRHHQGHPQGASRPVRLLGRTACCATRPSRAWI